MGLVNFKLQGRRLWHLDVLFIVVFVKNIFGCKIKSYFVVRVYEIAQSFCVMEMALKSRKEHMSTKEGYKSTSVSNIFFVWFQGGVEENSFLVFFWVYNYNTYCSKLF